VVARTLRPFVFFARAASAGRQEESSFYSVPFNSHHLRVLDRVAFYLRLKGTRGESGGGRYDATDRGTTWSTGSALSSLQSWPGAEPIRVTVHAPRRSCSALSDAGPPTVTYAWQRAKRAVPSDRCNVGPSAQRHFCIRYAPSGRARDGKGGQPSQPKLQQPSQGHAPVGNLLVLRGAERGAADADRRGRSRTVRSSQDLRMRPLEPSPNQVSTRVCRRVPPRASPLLTCAAESVTRPRLCEV
jgi:hypothetical protein